MRKLTSCLTFLALAGALSAQQSSQQPEVDERGEINVKLAGAKGDGATDDTAKLQRSLDIAARLKTVAFFPPGTYMTHSPLEVSSSIEMAPGAVIRAMTAMRAVINIGSSGPVSNGSFVGGEIDANDLADDGVFLRQYQHFELERVAVSNAVINGFHFGDPTLKVFYEGIGHMLRTGRNKGKLRPGSTGLLIDRGTDNNIAQSVFVDSEMGVKSLTGGNFFSDIHVWSHPSRGWMATGFEDQAVGNFWQGCEADTTSIGIHCTKVNTIIIGCRFFNNKDYGRPDEMVGVKFDQPQPYSTLVGNLYVGQDKEHELAKDFDHSPSLDVVGNKSNNVKSPK